MDGHSFHYDGVLLPLVALLQYDAAEEGTTDQLLRGCQACAMRLVSACSSHGSSP